MRHHFLITITLTLALSACSPEQIFSQLVRTEVEQGAAEAIQRQQVQARKVERIESKKSEYSEYVVLAPVQEESPYQAIAYRNKFTQENKSILDLEVIAPNPGDQMYAVWVKRPGNKTYQKLGNLEAINTDDYTFTYESQADLTHHSIVAISRDHPDSDSPENIILLGEFAPAEL